MLDTYCVGLSSFSSTPKILRRSSSSLSLPFTVLVLDNQFRVSVIFVVFPCRLGGNCGAGQDRMLQCLSASAMSSFQFPRQHRFVSCCQKHYKLLQQSRGAKVHPGMKLVHLRVAHALSACSAAGYCGRRLC